MLDILYFYDPLSWLAFIVLWFVVNLSVACPAVACFQLHFHDSPIFLMSLSILFLSVEFYLVLCLACWGNCWLLLTCPFAPFYAGVWSTFKHDTWRCWRGRDNCWDRWWNIWRNCARKFICFSPLILDKCSVSQLVQIGCQVIIFIDLQTLMGYVRCSSRKVAIKETSSNEKLTT